MDGTTLGASGVPADRGAAPAHLPGAAGHRHHSRVGIGYPFNGPNPWESLTKEEKLAALALLDGTVAGVERFLEAIKAAPTVICGWCDTKGVYLGAALPGGWRWIPIATSLKPACPTCQRDLSLY